MSNLTPPLFKFSFSYNEEKYNKKYESKFWEGFFEGWVCGTIVGFIFLICFLFIMDAVKETNLPPFTIKEILPHVSQK